MRSLLFLTRRRLTIVSTDARARAIAEEQPYITKLYEVLDGLRDRMAARLAELYKQEGWDEQSIWERDVFAARDLQRLQRLRSVDRGLCFGRLDFDKGTIRYVGRIGLSDDEYDQLLIDWRAPAAEPFYRATAAAPGDVTRRRHIQTSKRQVTGVEDEVFNADSTPATDVTTLSGEAALLATLNESRTGRMSDIVATIQAEQDRIIRSDARGVLVVQGAPGTGKTVAALHRAAYLLYTHRDRLANSGVLVLGPNRTFLRYIDQVLPSLGETGVVLSTVAELFPGVTVTAEEPDDVALAKGEVAMAELVSAEIKKLQRAPRQPIPVQIEGMTYEVAPATIRNARTRARRSRRPHNAARAVFSREILTALAEQYVDSADGVDENDVDEVRFELAGEDDVQSILNELWPVLTPEQLVRRIYASADPASPWFRRAEEWTPADIPVLDEAAELLGDAPDEAALAAERRAEAERRADEQFARDLIDELDLSMPVDETGVAARYRGESDVRPVNERAPGKRDWTYGHLIVDEAQELSPMAWRMVMRRVPSKSMTVVGDIAQTGAADGTRSWADVFDLHTPGRWRQRALTINYRAPAEVMEVGARVLAAIDPSLEPPQSVRSTGEAPWVTHVDSAHIVDELADAVSAELKALDGGRIAVIVPMARDATIRDGLTVALSDATVGRDDPSGLDADVAVLTVRESKGLEFDSVIVVEPAEIVDESRRGLTDLYVAVTRPTQRLGIMHSTDLPPALQ